MRFFLFLLAFFGFLVLRGGSPIAAFVVAIVVVVVATLVMRLVSRTAQRVPRPGRKPAPRVVNGDIGPLLAHALERGDREAALECLTQHIPASWPSRQGILMLADEHCRLQRSIRIARQAGVPLPQDTEAFFSRQTGMIVDRARRMAFVHQHGLMTPQIAASLERLVRGAGALVEQSAALRAELAASTGSPEWGSEEERELRRTLERMTTTMRAMGASILTDEQDGLVPAVDGPGAGLQERAGAR
jgi:hypothetical protein